MEITKTIPADGAIGTPLVYTIHIQNTGKTTAYEVILEDPIPQGAKLTGTVPQAELDAGRLNWELGTMKPGDQHKILVRVIPTRAGDLGSTATVRFASHAAAITQIAANKAAPAASTTSTRPIAKAAATAPDSAGQANPTTKQSTNPTTKQSGIALQVTAPDRANVGDVLTLKFTLTNHTLLDQTGIVLRNEISAQLEHPAGSDLEYPLPTLAAGASKEITLQVTAKTKGPATNSATLTSGQKLLAIDKDTIQIGTPQVLTIEQTVPPQASIGAATELKIVITNNSQAPTQPATLSQTLAPGLDFLASSGESDYDPVNGQISWQLASLPAGATATFTTTVRPRQISSKLTSLVRLTAGTRILATSSQSMKTVGSAAP